MTSSSTGKKGSKKYGRLLRKPAHSRYLRMNRYLSNKIRKLKKHINALVKKGLKRKVKTDKVAVAALRKLTEER